MENYFIKNGVAQQVRDDKYVVYSLIKANPSAVHSTTVTYSLESMVKEGKLLEGRKSEAFINKVRIPGGDISGAP